MTADNGKILAEGTKTIDCAPHVTVDVALGAVKLPNTIREAYLNISWTRREASSRIDKDWEVAYDQFVFAGNKNYTGYRPQKAGETTFTVDKQTGALLCNKTIGWNFVVSTTSRATADGMVTALCFCLSTIRL